VNGGDIYWEWMAPCGGAVHPDERRRAFWIDIEPFLCIVVNYADFSLFSFRFSDVESDFTV